MSVRNVSMFLVSSLLLTACDAETLRMLNVPSEPEPAYRAAAANSTEVVNMNLKNQMHLSRLAAIITQDPPSRVDLNCETLDPVCAQAKALLEQNKIPVVVHDRTDATLVYTRAAVGNAPSEAGTIENSNVQTAPPANALPKPAQLWQKK